jgi:RNA-directed DNA polymerase
MPGKQTTTPEGGGWPLEAGVEPRGKAGALSISPASERRRDDKPEVKEEMLEKILSKDNLNQAYKRVKANKGSPGVDGMTVEKLLPYLKQEGQALRQKILAGEYRPQPVRRV